MRRTIFRFCSMLNCPLCSFWKCCKDHLGFELSLVAASISLAGPALVEQWVSEKSNAGMPTELGLFWELFNSDRASSGTFNFYSDQKNWALSITLHDWLLCCMFCLHGSLPVVKHASSCGWRWKSEVLQGYLHVA